MNSSGLEPDQIKFSGKRLKHSYYPLLFVPVLLLSLLMGCQLQSISFSGNEVTPVSSSTPTISKTEINTTAASATPAATATEAAANHLVIWLPPQFDPAGGTEAGALIQSRLNSFITQHPNLTIEVRLKALDGKGGLLNSLINTSYAAPDALPVLIALPYKDMENAALKGLLLPMTGTITSETQDGWLPYSSQFSLVQNGEYGLPFAIDALVLVYNPRQIAYPPATWQTLASQKLPVIFPAADEGASVITAIYQTAGGDLSPDVSEPMVNEQALQKTYSILGSGADSGAFPVWVVNYSTFSESWAYYKAHNSGYALAWASQVLGDPISGTTIKPLPAIGDQQVTRAEGWVWCVPVKNPKGQDISALLAEYLSDPEFVDQFDQKAGYLPVYSSGLRLVTDANINDTIVNLFSTAQILPSNSTISLVTPLFKDEAVQIIKKELYFQNAMDLTMQAINAQ